MKKILIALIISSFSHLSFAQQLFYTNPILAGFYPDPSICRAGDDYYLTNSTFSYFPGLPIFHSKDLVNWKQIGHAMDRPEQLNHDGARVTRGLFAPAITYHNGTFYITCTHIDKGGNFVITAKNPAGPWSNPYFLPEVNGIDPSLFFDQNGKAYILYNSVAPDNKSLYDGHRTIRMYEFDPVKMKVTGEEKLLVNGGTRIESKPVWIEGPHIFQKDGWYYLVCAEGGTGYNHSEVVFRSKNVEGPFISYENNPILTQRHLDPKRKNPITTTGHADFIETKDGKWYAVFLGCRPYDGDHYNTGRETFMAPVNWKEGWPVILEGDAEVQYKYPVPMPGITKQVNNPFNGNVHFRDDFNASQLDPRWIFLRTIHEKWYDLRGKKGFLSVQLRPENCIGTRNPSFVAFRQQNMACSAATSLLFAPNAENEKAGLIAYYDEHHFFYYCKSVLDGKPVVQLFRGRGTTPADTVMGLIGYMEIEGKANAEIQLKIECTGDTYIFSHSMGKNKWVSMDYEKSHQNARFLSTKLAGGFTGSVFALYATSQGKATTNKVFYNWFEYRGNDQVFKQ